MSKQIFVKPEEGTLVRDPKTMEALPVNGMFVEYNSFWRRRLRDKSVVISKPEKKVIEKEEDLKEDKKGGRK